MSVEILGTRIILWCFDVRKNSIFKVVIGDGNDIDDLKEAINEKIHAFASHELKLWRVNTDQAIYEELLTDELKNPAKTIRETFSDVKGDNIRVVVRAPDTDQPVAELKRHMDQIAAKVDGVNSKVDGVNSKVDGVNSKVDGVNSKMDGLSREVKRVRFAADAWYSAIGTPTKTEKGKFVQENGVQIDFQLDLTKTYKTKSPGKDTHFSPLLDTRKPDFVFIPSDSPLDPLSVVVVGEIKKRVGESFSNADIGHAISFANSPPIGWKYLVTIMESSPERLGWVEPSLKFGEETVKLVRSIGVGRTSVVYEGIYKKDISVAVKMLKKANYLSCIERERAVLDQLSELDTLHIPKILFHDENTLVMTPLGVKVNNLRKPDIKDIINTLKQVHLYGYVHRDLRKYNFLRNLDHSKEPILIIDWGFSTKNCEDTAFAGALECMPDLVLESLTNEKNIAYGPKVDLICFVRSFYLMLHKPSMERVAFDRDDDIRRRAQMVLNFWKDCSKSDVWVSIYQAIEDLDYDKLIQELERFF
ncbi:kinase-like protein [Gigaspora margarita]|uniref:Kinase-like protein n=1 Tax=Gigaspora margarita TaxID=4874 RepID=A0A8H4EHV5_GIGMA|nr:kinase-like protein [Gigaspora margarita]